MRSTLGAIAVVAHEGQVLLVRRKKQPDAGKWGFPGGHVESGETALAAAARELAEETGVIATPLRYLTNIDIVTRDDAGDVVFHYLLAAVECRFESGTPAPSDEISGAQWFMPEAVEGLETSDRVQLLMGLIGL